ncbi:MAG: SDR family oxidoreductase [Lachnospiraceae bacterium]|nr:SDR family oxidoreductase [Lachnospiraceae bacterium]
MSEVVFNYIGKNFIVVGASSGMGKQTAMELAQAGAHVLAIARSDKRLSSLQAIAPNLIDTAVIDVTTASDEQWEQTIRLFIEKYGKIDGAVYTAGTTGTTPLRLHDGADARNIMETGFWGAMKCLEIVTKKKYSKEGSSFVVFSSTAAYLGGKGMLVYSGTKAAVQAAVHSVAKEIAGRKLRINSISPGWVKTEMTGNYLDHMGQSSQEIEDGCFGKGNPEDVTGMVLFLLSNRARWITGVDFIVDGGFMYGK